MIPSVVLDGRLMLSGEIDYCKDYFPVCSKELNNENEMPDDRGLVLGYQALLAL